MAGKSKAPIVMDAKEFRVIQAERGWSNVELARRVYLRPEPISRFRSGKAIIPGPLAAYLRLATKANVV